LRQPACFLKFSCGCLFHRLTSFQSHNPLLYAYIIARDFMIVNHQIRICR
jgi:hypothetical protein